MKKFLINKFFAPKGEVYMGGLPEHMQGGKKQKETSDYSQKMNSLIESYINQWYDNSREKTRIMNEIKKLNQSQRQEIYNKVINSAQELTNNWDKLTANLYKTFAGDIERSFKTLEKKYVSGVSRIQETTQVKIGGLTKEVNETYWKTSTGRVVNREKTESGTIAGWRETLKDSSSKLEFDKNGNLTKESLLAQMSDLDGKSGVEVKNVNIFSRFFGKESNKFEIGEAQVMELMKSKNLQQLNQIYSRITGDNSSLDLRKTKDGGLSKETTSKILNFRKQLVEQASAVGTMTAVIFGNEKARSGLSSLIDGNVSKLESELSNPQNLAKFLEQIKSSKVIEKDPKFLEKLGWTLVKIGLNVGAKIASAGVLTLVHERESITAKSLSSKLSKENLSYTIAQKDAKSVKASIDAIGVRVEWNWNDPKSAMSELYTEFAKSPDKLSAGNAIADKVRDKIAKSLKWDNAAIQELNTLTANFKNNLQKNINLVSSLPPQQQENRINIINKSVTDYLGKVFALKWLESKGLFLSANLAGLSVGLTGAEVQRSASDKGMIIDAGNIEASINDKEKLSDNDLKKILKASGIEEKDGAFYKDGKKIIDKPADGKKIQWNVQRVVAMEDIHYTLNFKTVPNNWKDFTFDQKFVENYNNIEANDYIEKNSKKVADYMLFARRFARTKPLVEAINNNDYNSASKHLEGVLNNIGGRKFPDVVNGLRAEFNSVKNNPQKLSVFMDNLLAKTQGGNNSRELADRLNSGQDISKDLRSYYEKWVAEAFANKFGISKREVMGILNNIISANNWNIKPKNVKDAIGHEKAFNWLVAYSQKWPGGLKGLDFFKQNAQIAGMPIDVSNANFADSIRKQMQDKIPQATIKQLQQSLPGVSESDIRKAFAGGKVKAALSYEKDAECFNLMFIVEPINSSSVEWNTIQTGSVIGDSKTDVVTTGIGAGISWEKLLQKKSKPQEQPKKQEQDKTKTDPKKNPGQEPIPPTDTTIPTPKVPDVTNTESSTNILSGFQEKVVVNGLKVTNWSGDSGASEIFWKLDLPNESLD